MLKLNYFLADIFILSAEKQPIKLSWRKIEWLLFNGNVDLRKGIFRLCESIREEMSLDPSDASNVYMFMSRNRKVVKILHYERGFYVLYVKRPVMGRFKKPVFDEVSKCYRIQWSDMAYLTESIVVDKMYVSPKD